MAPRGRSPVPHDGLGGFLLLSFLIVIIIIFFLSVVALRDPTHFIFYADNITTSTSPTIKRPIPAGCFVVPGLPEPAPRMSLHPTPNRISIVAVAIVVAVDFFIVIVRRRCFFRSFLGLP
jgi:hypothetical protein